MAPGVEPVLFLVAIAALFAVLTTGIVRRWRWTFWLIAVAFVAGAIRAPVAALELAGVVGVRGPGWYAALQGLAGIAQLGIGIAMLAAYRRGGLWGDAAAASGR